MEKERSTFASDEEDTQKLRAIKRNIVSAIAVGAWFMRRRSCSRGGGVDSDYHRVADATNRLEESVREVHDTCLPLRVD